MADKNRNIYSVALTVALVALNLIALNYLLSGWSTARVDLTQEGLFSISPSTERILTSLDEELTIHGYFSKRTHPKLAPLVPEILDLLDEYRAVSKGRVHVEIIDPENDEDAEQEAADRFGVRSTPFRLASKYETGIVNAYFALVVRYADQYERYGFEDLIEVEPLPGDDIDVRLRNLEYDLTRAIKKIVYGFRSTNELFERVEQPVRLTAVVTGEGLPDIFADVPEAVRKAADELKELGGDKFVFEEIDPSADTALQQELYAGYGFRPISLSFLSEESFFLYGILEAGGRIERLVLTEESLTPADLRETIENVLRRNTPGFLKTIGVVAPEPPALPPQLQMQYGMNAPPPEFEDVQRFLGQDYAVKPVKLDAPEGVPTDVDVLFVLKPRDLSDTAVFHLDQYLMRGGRIVLCTGTYDIDFSPNGLRASLGQTGLEEWLRHHGVTLEQRLVLDDVNQSLPIPEIRQTALGTMRTWKMAPYPYLVQVTRSGFLDRNFTASLEGVGIYWGSPLSVDESLETGLEVLPLLQSSERSWTSTDTSRVGSVQYEVPEEGTEPSLLALALNGKFKSYFSDKEVPVTAGDEANPASGTTVKLEESPETRMVVVGNDAFLSDLVARGLGAGDGSFAENLRFAENAIDWVSLDSDMIDIRARGLVSRQLDRTERRQEIMIESVNYALPVLLLLSAGAYLRHRRSQTAPLVAEPRSTSSTRPSREGV